MHSKNLKFLDAKEINRSTHLFCSRTIAAQNLLPTVKHFEDNWWYSMNLQWFIEQLGLKVFQHLETRTLVNDQQTWPRSFMVRLTREYCGFFLNDLDFGWRMEGVDTWFQELWTKYFTSELWTTTHSTSIHATNFMRDLGKIHKILTDEEIMTRTTERTKGYFFWRVLGTEMGMIRVGDKTLANLPKEMWETVKKIDENTRWFSIFAQVPATLTAQTLMGLPVWSDWGMDVMTSVHIDDSEIEREDLLWSKNITIRYND